MGCGILVFVDAIFFESWRSRRNIMVPPQNADCGGGGSPLHINGCLGGVGAPNVYIIVPINGQNGEQRQTQIVHTSPLHHAQK